MKNRFNLFLGTFAVIAMTQAAHADSDTWDGSQNTGTWSDAANWSTTPTTVPGTGDTATFSTGGGSVDVLNLGVAPGVTIGNIIFDTSAVAAYTIGSGAVNSQTLTLNDNGAITASSTLNANQLFNAALVLGTDATAQSYAITNNDTSNSLTFAGTITGGSTGTADIKTLEVSTAGGAVNFSGAISNGGATALDLTKSGGGTMTLSGANTYSGTTSVNSGTLNLTGSLGNTATTVVSGAFLTGKGSIGATGSLTFDSGSNLRLDGSTAGALTVGSAATGNLTLNPTTTVILDKVPVGMTAGTTILRVLNYNGSLTGSSADLALQDSANYRNPVFSTATLKEVNLSIDSSALTWSGASGAWDINTATNWNSGAEKFYQGDAVTFGDAGAKAVTITGTVQPTSVTFNNTTGNDYTVSGNIGGATTLTKNGTGKTTLSSANSFTGAITVNTGTLLLSNTTATGAVSIASGAVLETTLLQPFTGAVTASGAGTLRFNGTTSTGFGSFAFNLGSGAVIEVLTGGGGFNGGFGSNKTYANNKADLSVASGATFGTSNTNVRMDALTGSGSIDSSSGFTGGSFTFGVDDGSGDFSGELKSAGTNKFPFTKVGTGTQTLSGANTYTGATVVQAGILNLTGARTAAAGTFTVGNLASTTGTLGISNGTFALGAVTVGSGTGITTAGIINQTGGTLTTAANLVFGNGGTGTTAGSNASGTYHLSAGSLTQTAGVFSLGTNTGGTGAFNLSGTGALAITGTLEIGRSSSSTLASYTTGTFSQTGGSATTGTLTMGGANAVNHANCNATLSLTGGTFSATAFTSLSGGNNSVSAITIGGSAQVTLPKFPTARGATTTTSITFNSTTGYLAPGAAAADYMPAATFTNAWLTANGAKFNVDTAKDITIGQVLSNAPSETGTLTKSGLGTLTLTAPNTYSGATTVSAGTLSLGDGTANTSLADGSEVVIGASAVLNLNFLAANSDTVKKLTIGGFPKADGTWGASGSGAANIDDLHFSGPGTLTVNAAAGGGYSSWASTNGVPGQAANLDHDNDGVSNGVEYFIGGPAGPTTGFTLLPGITTVGATRSITWVKGPGYTGNYPGDFVVETSTTLAAGSWSPESSPGTVTISGSNVTYTFPAGPVKTFARLKVTGP